MAYKDTEVEPRLRPIAEQNLNPGANKAEQARTDIRINSFERDFQDTHMDIKVINAQADAHKETHPSLAMKKAEEGKERSYKERLQKVENASFVPIIFTSKGARSRKTAKALTMIANKIALKRKEERQVVANRMATDLSFLFLRMEMVCIRGRRKPRTQPA